MITCFSLIVLFIEFVIEFAIEVFKKVIQKLQVKFFKALRVD